MQLVGKFFSWWGEKRLDAVTKLLRGIPETSALLDLAAAEKIPVTFEPMLLLARTLGSTGNAIPEENRPTFIELNPFASKKSLAKTLAHELRHVWQMRQMENPGRITALDFAQSIAFKRFLEADAYVFESYIARKLGISVYDPDAGLMMRLLGQEPEIKAAATPQDQQKLFDAFQSSFHAGAYDRDALGVFNNAAKVMTNGLPEETRAGAFRSMLQEKFNLASFRDIGDLNKIPVISGTPYLSKFDSDAMLESLWRSVYNPAVKQARDTFRIR